MPDHGDKGNCGTRGCQNPGDHEITCGDCGGLFGYLCDTCADDLNRDLEAGRTFNARREREENERGNRT